MRLTPIQQRHTEQVIKSLIGAPYRDFTIVFAASRSKFLGHYLRKTRTVTLHPQKFDNRFELIGGGLHEAAHHITWERHPGARKAHGKEFRAVMGELIGAFNFAYREHIKGRLIFDPKRPAQLPRFLSY